MKKIHLGTIFIGLLISWGVEVLIPFVHTILDFIMKTSLSHPLRYYLLWGYLAVVLSGIYVGLSKANYKIINGAVVGMVYYITFALFIRILLNRNLSEGLLSFGYAFLKHGFICAVAAWGTYRVKVWLRTGKLRWRGEGRNRIPKT